MASTQLAITSVLPFADKFFKPVKANGFELLFKNYARDENRVTYMHDMITRDDNQRIMNYLTMSNDHRKGRPSGVECNELEQAIRYLDADFWRRALDLTDVYEFMPQDRRTQWDEDIRELNVPKFETETVVQTMRTLLLERDKFFAERVDGIFNNLSDVHLTNQPQGFSKRMISWWSRNPTMGVDCTCAGYLTDLRIVIAKLLDREADQRVRSYKLLEYGLGRIGEWFECDGGAFKMKMFRKGTMHIEIHPDIAWRMNEVLAFLHPMAIPAEFRVKKAPKVKKYNYTLNILPHDIRSALDECEVGRMYEKRGATTRAVEMPNTAELRYSYSMDKHVVKRVHEVFAACGGKRVKSGNGHPTNTFQFDYDFVGTVLPNIVMNGTLPDKYAFQYFPTCKELAVEMIDWSGLTISDDVLEPSCGQAGIAKVIAEEYSVSSLTCVEISETFADIAKETLKPFDNVHHAVINLDFLDYAKSCHRDFDVVVMNPPFSMGRAIKHTMAAANLLKVGGVLVGLVPDSAAKALAEIPGYRFDSRPVDPKRFPNVSIGITMIRMEAIS